MDSHLRGPVVLGVKTGGWGNLMSWNSFVCGDTTPNQCQASVVEQAPTR